MTEDSREISEAVFKGIAAIGVTVAPLSEIANKIGLTEEMIRTDVELKLRLAGLAVVMAGEVHDLPGSPHILITVSVMGDGAASYVYAELIQNAALQRTEKMVSVSTWAVGVLLTNQTGQVIRDFTKDIIDKFLNEWLSVNPAHSKSWPLPNSTGHLSQN